MRRLILVVMWVVFSVSCFAGMLEDSGVKGGVVVCVGADATQQLSNDWKAERYLFHCLETSHAKVSHIQKSIQAAGCYGKVSAAKFNGVHLPYQDNLVNLLVVDAGFKIPSSELVRVVTPNGVIMIGGKKIVKPVPAGSDDWSHFLHGPDNNAVSKDTRIDSPRGLQWESEPRWGRSHEEMASMSTTVTSGGRVFFIVDESTLMTVRFASDWKLVARDAYNGTLLWKQPIPNWVDHLRHFRSGPVHLQRRLVAVGNTVFVTLGLDAPVRAFDAATGELRREYAGTEYTEEISFKDGIVYLVVGTSEKNRHGEGLFERNEPKRTDFRFVTAIDAASGKVLWKKDATGSKYVLPLTMTLLDDRIFFQTLEGLVCCEAKSGKQLWLTPRETPDKRMGFSAPTMLASDGVLLCADRLPGGKGKEVAGVAKDQVVWGVHGWNIADVPRKATSVLKAYDIKTGKELWEAPCKEGYNVPVDVFIVKDRVYLGPEFKAYDLKMGAEQETPSFQRDTVGMPHPRCYRNKASEKYIFQGDDGIEMLDLEKGWIGNNSWMRGTCQYGIMPANGLIYVPPNACACNIRVKQSGFFAATTAAGGNPMPQPAPNAFEKGPAYGKTGAPMGTVGASDWPMYRQNPERSGSAKTDLPAKPKMVWSAKIGGKLTQPVSALGVTLVAAVDQHTVHAFNSQSGKPLWTYTAGARIDSPPTIFKGLVVFGCRDGWLYCLRASDGELSWRYRVAPEERLIGSFGQLESVWPVHGAVLVQNGMIYATAGRSTYMDGGVAMVAIGFNGSTMHRETFTHLNPENGKQMVAQTAGSFDIEGARSDILTGDGSSIFLKQYRFDASLYENKEAKPHLHAAGGFLLDEWYVRDYWLVGTDMNAGYGGWAKMGNQVPAGRIVSFGDDMVFTYGRQQYVGAKTGHRADQYCLRGIKKDFQVVPKAVKGKKPQKGKRKKKGPSEPATAAPQPAKDEVRPLEVIWEQTDSLTVRAMVSTPGKLAVAGVPDIGKKSAELLVFENEQDARAAFDGRQGIYLRVLNAADGKTLSETKLSAMPVFDGMVAANGKVLISLQDGSIQCWGN